MHNIVKNQTNKDPQLTGHYHEKQNLQQCISISSLASANHTSRDKVQSKMEKDIHEFCCNRNNTKQKNSDGRGENNYPVCCWRAEPITFTTLKDLASKHPNEILLSINKRNCGFMVLIGQKDISSDLMAFVLISLGKASSVSLNQNASSLLNTVCSNKNFVISIKKYLESFRLKLELQDFHLESLTYSTIFLWKLQQILPASSCETISMLLPLLQSTCEFFLKAHKMHDHVIAKLREIGKENCDFLSQHTAAELKKASIREVIQSSKPPENFRSIPVLPNDDDLHSNAFLRPNIVEGKYFNTEQYLDIQYRLLREDYMKPLRDGIAEYLKLKKAGKPIRNCRDVQVYKNVHIVKHAFVNGAMVHILQFEGRNFSRVDWDCSKQFLTGSLLCLSPDNFQTMLFASVAKREPKQLRKGLLLICFEEMSDEILLTLNHLKSFVVIETSAYFEAYRHNLKALQGLSERTLPFKRYIVNVENTVKSPQYLRPETAYDIRPLLIPLEKQYIKCNVNYTQYDYPRNVSCIYKSVKILNDSCWPSASSLNFDNSQYLALKAAVTKEFAIIQGPPGTGKTFIGLRIVQLLLHNIDKWFSKGKNYLPILIVCYTNHALDQFLEGLTCFTNKIIRVGGRGTNEIVSKFQLRKLKRKAIENKKIPNDISSSIWKLKMQLKDLTKFIDKIIHCIQDSTKIVFGENDLKKFIPAIHYDSLKNILKHPFFLEHNLSDDGLIIHDWLGIRSRGGWNDLGVFEAKQMKPQVEKKNPIPELYEAEDVYVENIGEADIEFLEAQRDIDLEDFASVSFDIESPEREDFLLPVSPLEEREAMGIKNIWTLDVPKRWQLYKFWLEKWVTEKHQEYMIKQSKLKQLYKTMCELRTEEDIFVLKKAHVVGMTTTGAAKYRDIVLKLNPQILIVEEAAEVLESHIVTSLAPKTQHVILIGDHQQLRPSPTVHMLAVKYNLNISLFERMIKNKMDYFQLSIQHRMRPEVAGLIVPHIYNDLKNHEVVMKYENIKGVSKNVFFVNHSYSELQESNTKSKINEHEAKFMIRLCIYFVLQGYDPSRITVLTTYSGQLTVMKKLIPYEIQNVRFAVVDNFQGEENDIILISFVRSNKRGEIGFLKVANRVCVALSRAKKGLFCIGNFEMLAEKSNLWKAILNTLKEKQSIKPSLQLQCQNHPHVRNMVANEKDFESVPEGGCNKVCDYLLDCGHKCCLMCHPYDKAHKNICCQKLCNKTCEFGHKCPNKCFEECICKELVQKTFHPCGHTDKIFCHMQKSDKCSVLCKKVLMCGHTIKMHCHMKISKVKCMTKCEKKLECGHKCSNICSDICTRKCKEKITISSPICGHMVTIECYEKTCPGALIKYCKNPCNFVLNCGHKCKGNCHLCHQGRLHVACNQPCKRILVCGHECKAPCAKICPPCKVPCENKCSHTKCSKKCGEPCVACTERCKWHCKHQKCSRTCGETCNRGPCDIPCPKSLPCGHPCIGFCGEPCPFECRLCDSIKVKDIFVGPLDNGDSRFIRLEDCNHIIEVNTLSEWMKADISVESKIQMKVCPSCKTIIRRNFRFGNIVKNYLRKIENVKILTFGNIDSKKEMELLVNLRLKFWKLKILKSGLIYSALQKSLSSRKCKTTQDVIAFENIFSVSLQLADVVEYFHTSASYISQHPSIQDGMESLSIFLSSLKNWLLDFIQDNLMTASEQQLHQLTWETHRLHLGMMLSKLLDRYILISPFSDFQNCVSSLIKYSSFGDEDARLFKTSFQSLAQSCKCIVANLCKLEKQPILKFMNLANGHWHQCPKGHLYCIAEFDGAMEKSQCFECSAKIDHNKQAFIRVKAYR